MRHFNTQLPARQRGALYAAVILLLLVGAVITATLKIVPAYNDNNIVKAAVESIAARPEHKTMSISDIRKEVLRSLRVNNIENFDADDVKSTSRWWPTSLLSSPSTTATTSSDLQSR